MTSNLVNRELGMPIFLLKLLHLTPLLVLQLQNNICIAFYYIVAEVPKEILFKGQRTMRMYQKALSDGFVNVYRGRIFLIGQDRAGKTSLKKSLLGVPFDPKEESTEGIDPSKCDIDVNRVQNWHVDSKNTILSEVSEQISRSLALELFPSEASEQISRSLAVEHFPSSPRIARDGSALRLNGASSRQGSREKEMIASNVFYVKLGKVSILSQPNPV